MIKLLYLSVIFAVSLSTMQAARPDSVGKGKSGKEISEAHKKIEMDKAEKAKSTADEQAKAAKEKAERVEEAAKREKVAKEKAEKALEKAKEKKKSDASDKTDAVRKEAGKGSETGQTKREENSRKWWKFWGD